MTPQIYDYSMVNTFPMKLLKAGNVLDGNGKIMPRHIVLYPTNRCTRNCSYCSCGKADRNLELDIYEIYDILDYFKGLGARAITLTGGGEPTLHENFESIYIYAIYLGYSIGLITNGDLLYSSKLNNKMLNNHLSFCRVSLDHEKLYAADDTIKYASSNLPDVDVSFSHVVTGDTNPEEAARFCEEIEYDNISHIRFVQDAFNPDVEAMENVKRACKGKTSKAIFRYRGEYEPGYKKCYAPLLRPTIAASGYIYPCCCVQFAIKGKEQTEPEETKMCHWTEYDGIQPFDGSVCHKCYHGGLNQALSYIDNPSKHVEFI